MVKDLLIGKIMALESKDDILAKMGDNDLFNTEKVLLARTSNVE